MTPYLVFAVILGLTAAVPIVPSPNRDAEITNKYFHQEFNEDQSWSWKYENSDGTQQDQSGYVKNPGTKDEGIFVQGSFQYPDKDTGSQIVVKYTADENGFVPEGSHLPTPPPFSEQTQKLLALIYGNARKQVRQAQLAQADYY